MVTSQPHGCRYRLHQLLGLTGTGQHLQTRIPVAMVSVNKRVITPPHRAASSCRDVGSAIVVTRRSTPLQQSSRCAATTRHPSVVVVLCASWYAVASPSSSRRGTTQTWCRVDVVLFIPDPVGRRAVALFVSSWWHEERRR